MRPTTNGRARLISAADARALEQVAAALAIGAVVAFPTDTVYAVGAHGLSPEAVERLYVAKERPLTRAIPLLLPGTDALAEVCESIPHIALELADHFWPGAISLVLPRARTVPDIVTGGGPTVAVRVPDHSLPRALCRQLRAPLAATSANRHGEPPLLTAQQVMASLGDRLSLVLDGGPAPGGIPSTVLDLTVSPPAILRPGPITAQDLQLWLEGRSRA